MPRFTQGFNIITNITGSTPGDANSALSFYYLSSSFTSSDSGAIASINITLDEETTEGARGKLVFSLSDSDNISTTGSDLLQMFHTGSANEPRVGIGLAGGQNVEGLLDLRSPTGSSPVSIILRTNEDGVIEEGEETGRITFAIESSSYLGTDFIASGSTAAIYSRVVQTGSSGAYGSLIFEVNDNQVSTDEVEILTLGYTLPNINQNAFPYIVNNEPFAVLSGSLLMRSNKSATAIFMRNDSNDRLVALGPAPANAVESTRALTDSFTRGGLKLFKSESLVVDINSYRADGDGSYIDDGKNFGIGTTSPSEKLTVEGNISASGNIYVDELHGDGSNITNLPSTVISSYTNPGNNRLITSVDSTTVNGESNLTFDGSLLTINGTASVDLLQVGNLGSQNEIVIVGANNEVISSNLLSIDQSNSRVGIGTSSPATKFHIAGEGENEGQIRLQQANNGGDGPDFAFYSSRGTIASPSAVQNNDTHGRINAYPYNGESFIQAGSFGWSATDGIGNNTFDIRSRVNGTLAKRIEITSTGDVDISGSLSASVFSGSFTGDGSNLTNITVAASDITGVVDISSQTNLAAGNGIDLTGDTISADVTSVAGQTGAVTLTADDISDTGTTNKFTTQADITKLSNLNISGAGDFVNNEFIVAVGTNAVTSSDALAVDSAGNLGIGISTPEVRLHMRGESAQTAQFLMEQYNDTADAPDIRTRRFRGTPAAPADVQTGDYLFRINVEGRDDGSNATYGSMQFDVDGTDQDALNWRIQTRDTAGTLADRITIDSAGDTIVAGEVSSNTIKNIETTLASDSATNVDTFATATYKGAIYDYVLYDAGVGARTGQFMVIQDNSNIDFTDNSTPTIGSEATIPSITAVINGSNVEVKVTNGNGYTFKAMAKKL